jgi:peptidoglycan-associated lipoprotein
MRSLTFAVAGLCAVAISACATKPKPTPPAAPETVAPSGLSTEMPPPPSVAGAPYALGSQEDLAATAGERVFFDFDSYSLTAEARSILTQQAAWLARNGGVRVRIEGHADERGTREYNLALGARRADAVRQALIAQGVSPLRIETLSFGKERPLDPASNEAAWAQNRNGHTVVIAFAGR